MQPVLIGLHSVKRGGKNTTADFIVDWCSSRSLTCKQRGFADKAKLAFARQFFPECSMEWAIEWVDNYKLDPQIKVAVEEKRRPSIHIAEVEFREALANFATEGGRDVYGDDHWVDQLLPVNDLMLSDSQEYREWHESFSIDEGRRIAHVGIITDGRFANEIERIHAVGGIAVKIRRKDAEDAVIEEFRKKGKEIHRSELGLPSHMFDHVINNDDNDLGLARQRTEKILNGNLSLLKLQTASKS